MEIVLNLAWALCSLGLIGYWWHNRAANTNPMRVQIFALATVVLLLLPVISVSDDLLSMQGAFETDSSVRRILHENHAHLSTTPAFMALPQDIIASLALPGWTEEFAHIHTPTATSLASQSFSNRPPPQL